MGHAGDDGDGQRGFHSRVKMGQQRRWMLRWNDLWSRAKREAKDSAGASDEDAADGLVEAKRLQAWETCLRE